MKVNYRNFLLFLLAIVIVAVGVILIFSTNTSKSSMKTESQQSDKKQFSSPPKMTISPDKKYKAAISTSKGDMEIELFAKDTPVTVNNFVYLARTGFYDGTIFHRIIKDFMIQGGDPKGDGSGGPGYTFDDEKITKDYKRGIVAMANRGPNTNGSQFFIMHKDYDLPKNYVIFGQVINGLDTLDKIAETPTADNGNGEKSKPTETVKIEKIQISEE